MKIVHVNPYFYPSRGGIEHRIHSVCSVLGRNNEVTVVTSRLPGTNPHEDMGAYDIIRLESKFYGNYNPPYVVSKGLKETLDELSPDIVDFHYRWAPSYTRAMASYKGKKVFTWHNSYGEGEGPLQRTASIINDRLFLKRLKDYDAFTCISGYIRDQLLSLKISSDKLHVIENGVYLPSQVSGKEDGFILFVGRLVATKGVNYLLQAMKDIDAPLKICGKGPETDRLKSLATELGVDDKVDFLGYVSDEERDRLLDRCTLYVMPSTFEAYGIAVAEAMAHRKAVVCSNVGGLPEVVRDSGVLVPPRDPKRLAEAINYLLESQEERQRLGERAAKLAEEYSWDNVGLRTLKLYQSL